MANIKLNDIKPAGTELFNDSESFLQEVTEELTYIQGGLDDHHTHTEDCEHCPKIK